jgi:transposase-like protein
MGTSKPSYRGHRFPPEIIGHAVWLYCRFSLSFPDVEDLLAERGVIVSYEALASGVGRKSGQRTIASFGASPSRFGVKQQWRSEGRS